MPSRRPSHHLLPAVLVLGLAVAGLAACSEDDAPTQAPTPRTTTSHALTPVDVSAGLARALEARARAVRTHDAAAFARTVGGGRAFRVQQRTWFADLAQLPLARFRYRLDPASLVRDAGGYWVGVTEVMQLDGYDEHPVTRPDRFHFSAHGHGRPRLTSVTDAAWERAHDLRPQPWELGPIEVRTGPGVLGIFDADSVAAAGPLLGSVERGIADVSASVPYVWPGSVVVYALSDPAFIDGLEGVPGDDPGELDAVSFAAGESTRVVLNPRMVDRPGPARDRLVRHELTHVAVGHRADGVPTWLSEGIAEWVSVRPVPVARRRLPDSALAAAEAGPTGLPDDASFDDAHSQAHYGLAWWAVEYVARTYGAQAPWLLLDAMSEDATGNGTDAGQDTDRVLQSVLQIDEATLARRSARLLVATYAPAPEPRESPSPSPSPSSSSSDEPGETEPGG